MLIIPAWRRATAPIASSVGAGIGETRHGMAVPPPRGPSTRGRGPGKGTTEAGQPEALALRRKEQPDAPSAGLGARLVVLPQPAQHDAAVLGQRPVLLLIDDEGDGVDAIGSRYRRPGWDARRSGQERPYANPEAARQAAHTTAVRPAASGADERVRAPSLFSALSQRLQEFYIGTVEPSAFVQVGSPDHDAVPQVREEHSLVQLIQFSADDLH